MVHRLRLRTYVGACHKSSRLCKPYTEESPRYAATPAGEFPSSRTGCERPSGGTEDAVNDRRPSSSPCPQNRYGTTPRIRSSGRKNLRACKAKRNGRHLTNTNTAKTHNINYQQEATSTSRAQSKHRTTQSNTEQHDHHHNSHS